MDENNAQINKDGFFKFNNNLAESLLCKKLSDKQRRILLYIIRMSFGCYDSNEFKFYSYAQFYLCGIYKQNLKKELSILEDKNIIFWNKKNKTIKINKDIDSWLIENHDIFDKEKHNEYLSKTLKSNYKPNINKTYQIKRNNSKIVFSKFKDY